MGTADDTQENQETLRDALLVFKPIPVAPALFCEN